jgi:uncharacterized protein YciI
MLYMCYGVDGADGAVRRETTRDEHFAYLKAHKEILVLGGATLADEDDTRTGSVLIINVPDRTAAQEFADGEPFRKAGVFETYTLTRMRRGQWKPDAAPNTAEGD